MIHATVVRKFDGALFTIAEAIIPGAVASGLADGGESVRMNAMSNILNEGHGLTGELADSIHYEEGNISKNKVTGYVKTGALPQATTLEFGTGIYATSGTGSSPWFVHKDMAPDLGLYFPLYRRPNGTVTDFYRIEGTRPYPYMQPAAENTKDTVNRAVANAVGRELRRILPS